MLCFDADPDLADSHITREIAHHIAQRFLDWGLIADVEGDHNGRGEFYYQLCNSLPNNKTLDWSILKANDIQLIW